MGHKILGKYFQIAFLRDHFAYPLAEPLFPLLVTENRGAEAH